MIKVHLRNYRAFGPDEAVEYELGDGFTSFIGKNNAGKSTCIRAIYELRPLFRNIAYWNGEHPTAYHPLSIEAEPDPTVVLNFSNEVPAFVTIGIPRDLPFKKPYLAESTIRINRDSTVSLENFVVVREEGPVQVQPTYRGINQISVDQEVFLQLQTASGEHIRYTTNQFSEALRDLISSVYFGPYRNALNEGASKHYDIAVGTGVISQWDTWKAGSQRSSQKAIASVEADIQRLLGYQSLEINASSDNKTLNVTIDKKPFHLSDLGAGVAELIITLSNALVVRPSFLLIDEPENHLHPSLQVDFLTTLATYARKGLAFSTHSIGLARTISDRTYAVVRDAKGYASCRRYERQSHLSELLGNLSYSGYFPLEHAFVLLVEGSTDVRTFQILLRKLNKDHKYVILPLGGSQLIREDSAIELAEVVRIAGGASNVFAIIDSERSSEGEALSPKRAAFVATCASLKIACHVTTRRATENYFSDEAIQQALGKSFSRLEPFQLLKQHSNGWSKSENWRIANCEDLDPFSLHDVGEFLQRLPD